MTLDTLITYLRAEIGKHSDIKETDHGSEFDNDVSGNYAYPMVFIESQPVTRRRLTTGPIEYDMALLILDRHTDGDKADALRAVGVCEPIIDQIQEYLEKRAKEAESADKVFYSWSDALSITYGTDTIAGGWRVEFKAKVNGDRCSWRLKFPAL